MADYVDLDPGYDPYDAFHVDRRFGAQWLAKRGYIDFTSKFLQACADNRLIALEVPWWQYLLSGEFFDVERCEIWNGRGESLDGMNGGGRYTSDHAPVVADVSLTA